MVSSSDISSRSVCLYLHEANQPIPAGFAVAEQLIDLAVLHGLVEGFAAEVDAHDAEAVVGADSEVGEGFAELVAGFEIGEDGAAAAGELQGEDQGDDQGFCAAQCKRAFCAAPGTKKSQPGEDGADGEEGVEPLVGEHGADQAGDQQRERGRVPFGFVGSGGGLFEQFVDFVFFGVEVDNIRHGSAPSKTGYAVTKDPYPFDLRPKKSPATPRPNMIRGVIASARAPKIGAPGSTTLRAGSAGS